MLIFLFALSIVPPTLPAECILVNWHGPADCKPFPHDLLRRFVCRACAELVLRSALEKREVRAFPSLFCFEVLGKFRRCVILFQCVRHVCESPMRPWMDRTANPIDWNFPPMKEVYYAFRSSASVFLSVFCRFNVPCGNSCKRGLYAISGIVRESMHGKTGKETAS